MLYHIKKGIPAKLQLPDKRNRVIFTKHALEQSQNDKYGDFSQYLKFHATFDPSVATLVEVESSDGIHTNGEFSPCNKVVYRVPLAPNDTRELVMVLVPYTDKFVAKTVWINRKKDQHKSLNMKRYSNPR